MNRNKKEKRKAKRRVTALEQQVTDLRQQVNGIQHTLDAKQPLLEWLKKHQQALEGLIDSHTSLPTLDDPNKPNEPNERSGAEPVKIAKVTNHSKLQTIHEENSTAPTTEPTIHEAFKALLRAVWRNTSAGVKRTVAAVLAAGVLACLYTPIHIPNPWFQNTEPDVIIRYAGQVKATKNGGKAYFFRYADVTDTYAEMFYFNCAHCGAPCVSEHYLDNHGYWCASGYHYCSEAGKGIYAQAKDGSCVMPNEE